MHNTCFILCLKGRCCWLCVEYVFVREVPLKKMRFKRQLSPVHFASVSVVNWGLGGSGGGGTVELLMRQWSWLQGPHYFIILHFTGQIIGIIHYLHKYVTMQTSAVFHVKILQHLQLLLFVALHLWVLILSTCNLHVICSHTEATSYFSYLDRFNEWPLHLVHLLVNTNRKIL